MIEFFGCDRFVDVIILDFLVVCFGEEFYLVGVFYIFGGDGYV